MATKPTSTAASVNEVSADLKASSTTTRQTLRLLRALLGLDLEGTGIKAAPRRPQTAKRTPVPPKRAATKNTTGNPHNTKQVKAQPFQIYEPPEPAPAALTSAGKRKLATESFNTCLRNLADSVKRNRALVQDATIPANKGKTQISPRKTLPLQQCSPNRSSKYLPSSCIERTQDDEVEVVAECACAALDSLRLLELENDKQVSLQPFERERGALMLLEKLITLGFTRIATAQAVKIQNQYWKRQKDEKSSRPSTTKSGTIELSECLVLDPDPNGKDEFNFVTSFHSQVIRLAILQGPDAITDEFVQVIQMTNESSPASVVLKSHHAGYVDNEGIGRHLRTISLALFKLYSLAISQKAAIGTQGESCFSLLIETLVIKCTSWLYLQHKPELDRELWTHLLLGMKTVAKVKDIDSTRVYFVVKTSLKVLSKVSKECSFDSAFPKSIVSAFNELAENAGYLEDSLSLLEELGQCQNIDSPLSQVTIVWRKATASYTTSGNKDSAMLRRLENVLSSFNVVPKASGHDFENLLVYGSRLRRACSAIITETDQSMKDHRVTSTELSVRSCSIRILLRLTDLISSYILEPNVDTDKTQKGRSIPPRGAVMSFAKSIEAVLNVVICPHNILDPVKEELEAAAIQYIAPSSILMENVMRLEPHDALIPFVENTLIRLSNTVWTCYAKIADQMPATSDAVDLINKSLLAVASCRPSVQQKAFVGAKLERLAMIQMQSDKITEAKQAFEAAIEHYISTGALDHAAERALSKPSHQVWVKDDSQSYALGKVLRSHVQLCLAHSICNTPLNSWLYDKQNLPVISQCVLLEEQLHVCARQSSVTAEQKEVFIKCVEQVLELCSQPEYQIYRLRFVLNLLQSTFQNLSLSSRALFSTEVIKSIYNFDFSSSAYTLSKYVPSLRHSLILCWTMQSPEVDVRTISEHIESLSVMILRSRDLSSLEECFDNLDFSFKQLRSVLSYARMMDYVELTATTLLAIIHIIRLRVGFEHEQLVPYLTQIGTLYSRQGRHSEADKEFEIAYRSVMGQKESTFTGVQCLLAYVDHLIIVGNMVQVEQLLKTALAEYSKVCGASKQSSARARLERYSILSQSALIASQLAFQREDLMQANQFARQAVKLSSAIWREIEQPEVSVSTSLPTAGNDSSLHFLTGEMSNLTIASEESTPYRHNRGAAYWDHACQHYRSLFTMVIISIHNGLYQDALCYGRQMETMTSAIGSDALKSRAKSLLAVMYAKAGSIEKTSMLLEMPDLIRGDIVLVEDYLACISRIEALIEIGERARATTQLAWLETNLSRHIMVNSTVQAIVSDNVAVSRQTSKRGRPKPVRLAKVDAKHPVMRCAPSVPQKTSQYSTQKPTIYLYDMLEDRINILKDMLQLMCDDLLPEASSKEVVIPATMPTYSSVSRQITLAMRMLGQALNELSSDAIKCVLAETAVALPVRYRSSRRSGRSSFIQPATSPMKNPKAVRGKAKPTKHSGEQKSESLGESLLTDANRLLQNIANEQLNSCSSEMLHTVGKIRSKLALLSSTMRSPSNTSSVQLVMQALMPKDVSQKREQLSIKAEQATSDKNQILAWPSLSLVDSDNKILETSASEVDMDDLSEVPDNWSIVSLSLTEDQREILVSKVVHGKSPFLLRIPLSRVDIEVDEENEFTFQEARSELTEIITLANESCHDTRGQGSKEVRSQWYAERQKLDKRLETLLKNVESIWLGGFRGLMTASGLDEDLLVSFGHMLSRTLDQHLPSRQKSGNSSTEKVALHAHISELFLALGDPQDQELDDPVTDLLYFVIDILQFSGERNAYDEIDFDAMLVEVLDSLRSCHSAMSHSRTLRQDHTILILDKELAVMPWESLPCLQGRSVSRMPSLSAVMVRLKKIRQQNLAENMYSLSTGRGAYMLNPGSDLVSTQATFEPILRTHLPSFGASINTRPTEFEFASSLSDNDLFLYFGHGAGAHYICGRKIRSLDSCAVTLLMGCSSAKMTECGKFESYGMPGYYIGGLSGCMAVVGTLWDVTDRDIDRFALRLMVEWGLVPEDEIVTKALEKPGRKGKGKATEAKGKGKIVVGDIRDRRGKVSLDEAVEKAREACALRYLNGAAPIVYGVPVCLR